MKERLFFNWTFVRAIYFIMGILMLVQSLVIRQWFGILLGGYFASMGLFAFGCAAGNCSTRDRYNEQKQRLNPTEEIEYEEIK